MAPFYDPCLTHVAFLFLLLTAKKKKKNLGNHQILLKQILDSALKANPLNTHEMYDVPFLILSLCT